MPPYITPKMPKNSDQPKYRTPNPDVLEARDKMAYIGAIEDYKRNNPYAPLPSYMTVLERSLKEDPHLTNPVQNAQEVIRDFALTALAKEFPDQVETVSTEIVKAVATQMAIGYFGELEDFCREYVKHVEIVRGGLKVPPKMRTSIREVATTSALLLRQIEAVLPEFRSPQYLHGPENRDQALARLAQLIDFDKVEEYSGFNNLFKTPRPHSYFITEGERVIDEVRSIGFPPELVLLYLNSEANRHVFIEEEDDEIAFGDPQSQVGALVPITANPLVSILKNGLTVYVGQHPV